MEISRWNIEIQFVDSVIAETNFGGQDKFFR